MCKSLLTDKFSYNTFEDTMNVCKDVDKKVEVEAYVPSFYRQQQ